MFGQASQNIFGAKTTSESAISINNRTTTNVNLSTLAQFSTVTALIPDAIKTYINLAHTAFLTPFDKKRFNRIGTLEQKNLIVNNLTDYMNTITNDTILVTFLDCIIKATNAAYNMKHLEVTFIKYKEETTIEITNLQNQLNVLLGSTMKGLEGAGGVGTASFGIQLNEFLTTYIFIYGYHPNDENWITDERTEIVTDIRARIDNGEITDNDVLPELYLNT